MSSSAPNVSSEHSIETVEAQSSISCSGNSTKDKYSHLIKPGAESKKEKALRELNLFVLDNSIRESTVGQLKGHTVPEKLHILEEVKKCGFLDTGIVLSAFSHRQRVDDAFVEEVTKQESDLSNYYAFSDVSVMNNYWRQPYGLEKMWKYGLKNPIFEIDLAKPGGEDFTQKMCALLRKRINLTYHLLSSDSKIFINLRDMPYAMEKYHNRVFEVVECLGRMPPEKRPHGILYEEPSGNFLPETLGSWTKALRTLMDDCDWKDGHLLFHVHKKWGLAEAAQLECLANGANGIWASVCEEGAANGHASSIVTIMNLIRMGNEKVKKRYKCHYLRSAAINITELTTGDPPHPRQAIYGERALDLVFECSGIAGGPPKENEFDVAEFFGIKHPIRINHLSSKESIREKLVTRFGDDEQFTLEIADKMKEQIIVDLKKTVKCKEEYTSDEGLALLFERAGGTPTGRIAEVIEKAKPRFPFQNELLKQVKVEWDKCGPKKENDSLDYSAFYHCFMAPYFRHYDCDKTRNALEALDMYTNHEIEFREFCVYLKWALRQCPEIATTKQLLNIAFQKGLIPAMHQVHLTNNNL